MHCFIVGVDDELDAAIAEHRDYLQASRRYSAAARGDLPLAEAARDLLRRGIRQKREPRSASKRVKGSQLRLFG